MTTAEAGLLRCVLFVHNDEGTHSGFKLVPEDTTLEELRNMTSACGILQVTISCVYIMRVAKSLTFARQTITFEFFTRLQWWREEQLDLYAMQDRRPCSEEQYGQKLMDLCHPDRSLYLLLRPRGFLCLATSCLAALEKRDQLAAQEPEDGYNQDTRALPYQQACSAPASGSGLVAASGSERLLILCPEGLPSRDNSGKHVIHARGFILRFQIYIKFTSFATNDGISGSSDCVSGFRLVSSIEDAVIVCCPLRP
jgi:hypothetical protein